MKMQLLALLLVGILLFGCSQPPKEDGTNTGMPARPFMQVSVNGYSAEVPSGWSQAKVLSGDISYSNAISKSSIVISSLEMEGSDLLAFAQGQVGDLDSKYSIGEYSIKFARNGALNTFGGREWYVICYTFTNANGKALEQCSAMTACGADAGTVVISSDKGKLQGDLPGFQHALETFSC
ncbi:MAG TPA: hypothetical protein VJI13_01645 [Candidatus Norongarragalinales archaeon]|nr:hypothetical protein [Candidatus Norongarragalinales archaeon]